MARIIIVDDERTYAKFLSKLFAKGKHSCLLLHSLEGIEEAVNTYDPDVVFLDVYLPDGNGLDCLKLINTRKNPPPVVMITGSPDDNCAKQALMNGAWDFICKTDPLERILLSVDRATNYLREKRAAMSQADLRLSGIIGFSRPMQECLAEAARAAHSVAPVLVTGETGTGKELLARAIHQSSSRNAGEFVVVDCAALPHELVESILFGHKKGAFTGALADREGLVSLADGGTLFLDEIGELHPDLQKRFLRFLQEKTYRPIGAPKEEKSDFRIVAATNRDLDRLSDEGGFRKDLLHRLRSISIHLPPLKDRSGDVPRIVKFYVNKFSSMNNGVVKGISPCFLEAVESYDWPGNVRELVQSLEAAVSRSEGFSTIYAVHLPERVRARHFEESDKPSLAAEATTKPAKNILPLNSLKKSAMAQLEQAYLKDLVRLANGDVATACQLSGLGRSRLYALLKEHGVTF